MSHQEKYWGSDYYPSPWSELLIEDHEDGYRVVEHYVQESQGFGKTVDEAMMAFFKQKEARLAPHRLTLEDRTKRTPPDTRSALLSENKC